MQSRGVLETVSVAWHVHNKALIEALPTVHGNSDR